jgi:hypothetical protein
VPLEVALRLNAISTCGSEKMTDEVEDTRPKPLDRAQLYNLVWSEPIIKIAKRYGLSDVGLSKLCRRHNIPLPPRGYWAKLQAGKAVQRLALPNNEGEDSRNAILEAVTHSKQGEGNTQEADSRLQAERLPANKIVVPGDMSQLHPVIQQAWSAYRTVKRDPRAQYPLIDGKRHPSLSISHTNTERGLRILNAIFQAAVERGMKLEADSSRRFYTVINAGREKFFVHIREHIHSEETEASKKWQEKYGGRGVWRDREYDYTPTNNFDLELRDHENRRNIQKWSDRPGKLIEDRLNECLAKMIREDERRKALDQQRERWRQEYEAQQERRRQEERRVQLEAWRRECLIDQVERWRQAKDLREYLDEVERRLPSTSLVESHDDYMRWLQWGRQYADQLDPMLRLSKVAPPKLPQAPKEPDFSMLNVPRDESSVDDEL